MSLRRFTYILLIVLSFSLNISSQQSVRFLFYNTENFFDPFDDSLTYDDEFLPQGIRHWTYRRFQQKLSHLYKVIMAAGDLDPPAMIGLCEVENRWVLNQLVYETPLIKYEYKIIHKDSPDPRGIDVAFLYLPEIFYPVQANWLNIKGLKSDDEPTRDILYIKGTVYGEDTIHLFVNHWPSRWLGRLETEHKRIAASRILRKSVDSLFLSNPRAGIIIAGDLNDEPEDYSILEVLKANTEYIRIQDTDLYNLTAHIIGRAEGTYKYRGIWSFYDQIIVSGSLLNNETGLVLQDGIKIFSPGFLLEEDDNYLGKKPYRTFEGYKYREGFSDHLPVYVDIVIKE